MAVAVVHLFEMVDIQNQKHPAAVFQQRFIYMRFRSTAVVQAGEPVVLRQHAQTGVFILQHVKLLVHQHPPISCALRPPGISPGMFPDFPRVPDGRRRTFPSYSFIIDS